MALAYGCTYVANDLPHPQLTHVIITHITSPPLRGAYRPSTRPRDPLALPHYPNSEVGLILVGVMNAISAGLLTFTSLLVELLSEDFLRDASWRYLRGRRRMYGCLLISLIRRFFDAAESDAWA